MRTCNKSSKSDIPRTDFKYSARLKQIGMMRSAR
jgi:hypothetical protein